MAPDTSQAAVLALLGDPATHGGAAVRRIDTHISSIFLAGERAWKLKKAVTLPFLDFSTLESRRRACEAEIAVNRTAAADLYLGVVPVTRGADGVLTLGGSGEAVEWLVAMRRFDEDTLFDRLAASGTLDRRLLDALIEAVAAAHRAAPPVFDKGGAAGLAWTIDTNRASMLAAPVPLPQAAVDRLAAESHAWLERSTPLLEARRERGLVRRCHGDLHLGNICLFGGRPTLFDAIEFSDDIATVDVFYDLAFLLMDLDRRAGRAAAAAAMNHYLDLTGDYEAVAALPLMLSLRAGVRAHVTATMGRTTEAESILAAAQAYLHPPPPRLVAVGGLSGSGKSRLSRRLAPFLAAPGAVVVRSDAIRKQLLGCPLLEKLGPEGYTAEATARTFRALFETAAALLAAGQAVIADAVFARPEQRAAIAAVAAATGVRFDGLWLEAPPDIAAKRVAGRVGNASDATVEVLKKQLGYDVGAVDWTRLDTGGQRPEVLVAARRVLGV